MNNKSFDLYIRALLVKELDKCENRYKDIKILSDKMVEILRLHNCLLGSEYFDGEDRIVSKCETCETISKYDNLISSHKEDE